MRILLMLAAITLSASACGPSPEVAAARLINGLANTVQLGSSEDFTIAELPESIECGSDKYTLAVKQGTIDLKGQYANAERTQALMAITVSASYVGPGLSTLVASDKTVECTLKNVTYSFNSQTFKLTGTGKIGNCDSFTCKVNKDTEISCEKMTDALLYYPCQ